MPVSKNAVGKDYYEFLDKVVSKRIDKPLITEAPVDIYDNTPYPNWAFQDESGYIENSIGIDKIFDLLTKNKNYCIVWIPYSDLYFSFNSNHSYNYQTFFADSKVVDGRYKSDNKDLLIQLISHYYFGIDIALQFGINILPVKYVNKILNSQYTFGTDKYFTYGSFKSNYQSPDGNNTYRFLGGFNGVIGFNFTLPVNFRIIFNNTYYSNNNFYDDIKNFKKSNTNESIVNFLMNTEQYQSLILRGLDKNDLSNTGISKPTGADKGDPYYSEYVHYIWYGNYPKEGNANFIKNKGYNALTDYQYFLAKDKNKFFLEVATLADIQGKLYNTTNNYYYYIIFEGLLNHSKVYLKAYINPEMVFYFTISNLNVYISNKKDKKTLFMSADNSYKQFPFAGVLQNYNIDQTALGRTLKAMIFYYNSGSLCYMDATYNAKMMTLKDRTKLSNSFIYTLIDKGLEFKSLTIVTKSENFCYKVKFGEPLESILAPDADMHYFNFKFTNGAFDKDYYKHLNMQELWVEDKDIDTPPRK